MYNNEDMYISIDLGGTKTRVASTEDLTTIKEELVFKTVQDLESERSNILEAILKLSTPDKIRGICFGVPGLVDRKTRKFKKIVNVPAFSNLTFSQAFRDTFDDKLIFVQNDAALAGLGEAVMGAGQAFDVVAYITLSTGIGGIRISGRKIDPTLNFSEPGHMIINASDNTFGMCGQAGCLSSFVSGTGFLERYKESPVTCTNKEIWKDYAHNLSLGLINIISMWSPDVIVLGGSMTNSFDDYFKQPLLDELSKEPLFDIPPVVKASLGDNAGIFGGFVYLSQLLQ